MELTDEVWGKTKIDEPVIIELLQSDPVQRLDEIRMAGPRPFFTDSPRTHSRLEHSKGVMLLLRKYGASKEEQIAGLIHDVPHTAFSHVADFVFETENHEYHERFMEDIIYSSKVPEILEKYGYNIERILDESNFKLLEREMPLLCADRLDYSIRDFKKLEIAEIEDFKQNLITKNNEFVFKNFEKAEKFALNYIKLDSSAYASKEEVAIFQLFADCIKSMLDHGELEESDLFDTDKSVMKKIRKSELREVQETIKKLDSGIKAEISPNDYDFIGHTKARAVDPHYLDNGQKVRVSKNSEKVRKKIKKHKKAVNKGYKLKIK